MFVYVFIAYCSVLIVRSEILVYKHSTVFFFAVYIAEISDHHTTTFFRITKQSFTVYMKYTLAELYLESKFSYKRLQLIKFPVV